MAVGTQNAIDAGLAARACQVVRQAVWLRKHGITNQKREIGGILHHGGAWINSPAAYCSNGSIRRRSANAFFALASNTTRPGR